jgi:acyl-CoA thioesterase-1
VAQVTADLSHIVDVARKRGIAVLLCGMEALPIHGWTYTTAFHQMYLDLAARYQIPLVPFILMNVIGNPRLMQADHAHPNADGARAIADVIWPYLEEILKKPLALRPQP